MTKSERATQDWTLASIPPGETVEVLDVRGEQREALLVRGLRPGVQLVVDGDAPFGGPRIFRLGSSRVAIDRRLARTVRVARTATATGATGDAAAGAAAASRR